MTTSRDETIVHTTCNRDCPDACAIVATVRSNSTGNEIVRLQGDKEHPVTQGFLCYRTSHFLEQQNAPDRLLVPHVRDGDTLVPTTWDVALDRIAADFRRILDQHGPSAIFHYRSGGDLGALLGVADLFWQCLGPVATKSGDICTGAPDAAQDADFGGRDSNDLFDLENARQILVWGRNVFTSSPHSVPVLRRAKKAGASLTLIDPIHHRTARLCDVVVQPRPGADYALAMAVARCLFETGGVHPDAASWCDGLEDFRALCHTRSTEEWRNLADVDDDEVQHIANAFRNGPCTVIIGWGLGRRANGHATVRAIDALCAMTGNIGEPGAGASFYFNRKAAFRKVKDVAEQDLKLQWRDAPREISEPLLAEELDAKSTRAMWVTAGNPVAMLPGSARIAETLKEIETVVVVDTWWTDTARRADVVLPCATMLERDDIIGAYGHHYIGRAQAVVAPRGEAKTDLDILRALAPRLGLEDKLRALGFYDSDASWIERLSTPLAAAGVPPAALENGAVRSPVSPVIAWANRSFATKTGRAQLLSQHPTRLVSTEPPSSEGPSSAPSSSATSSSATSSSATQSTPRRLVLHTLSHPKSQSSQWVESATESGPAWCTVHPQVADGLEDGTEVDLESAFGRLRVRLRTDPNQRQDVAIVPKGGGLDAGNCANVLVGPALTDAGGGAALYDVKVRICPV